MQTLDTLVRHRPTEETNNFLLIRLLAATLVVYGHAFALAPVPCNDCVDIVKAFTSWIPSQTIGVNVFFIVSGFLVVSSYSRRDDLASYLKSRALRIFPGLVVCVALTVLVFGAATTSLPLGQYFRSPEVLRYFFVNASLYTTIYELPGVQFSSTSFGTAANGSLWTIPWEARLYLLAAMVGAFGLLKHRWTANVAWVAFIVGGLYFPSVLPLIDPYPGPYRLAAFFAAGAFFHINRSSIPIDWKVFGLLATITALSHRLPSFDALCALTLAYGVFCLAYAKRISLPKWVADYSYGIYLYSFPIQQIVAFAFPTTSPYRMMALSIPLSWAAGALSWHFIEKRALALKDRRGRDEALRPSRF